MFKKLMCWLGHHVWNRIEDNIVYCEHCGAIKFRYGEDMRIAKSSRFSALERI